MLTVLSPKKLLLGAGCLLVACVAALVLNHEATAWIQSPRFQDLLNRETSKGLKLEAHYAPLVREGLFGIRTESFLGSNGYKTIVSLDAHGVSGTFNPLGIYLRRWQIDNVHIKSGTVMIQKTTPTPGAPKGTPWPPWTALFWPYRVYLEDVKVDDANVLWKLQDKESGIYHTVLEITPNGRDFEYDARGGSFKMAVAPPLQVEHIHLLIRKPRLYCSDLVLDDSSDYSEDGLRPSGGRLRVTGDAGLQDDQSMHAAMTLEGLTVAPWLPESMRRHVEGRMNGHFQYTSTGAGMQTGHGTGSIEIVDGVLQSLPPIQKYFEITGSPNPGRMPLKTCRADLKWNAGALTAENLEVECPGVFRLSGNLTVGADKALHGELELGLTEPYIKWLPTARTAIFMRTDDGYHFTTVHFSGTTAKPEQDLTPRIAHELSKSPLVAVKLFFNSAGTLFDSH